MYTVICETLGDTSTYYPIRPTDVKEHLISVFGKAEVEETAEKLLSFFQSRGAWTSFTLFELAAFYKERGWVFKDHFFGLFGRWFDDSLAFGGWCDPAETFIVHRPDESYCVTDLFIKRCAKEEKSSG